MDPNNQDNKVFIAQLRRMVFTPSFEIMFTPDTEAEREIYSDFQFKRFFAEFLSILDNSTGTLMEDLINRYPIIDIVCIHIFRSILAAKGINEPFEAKIPTESVFGEFAEPLGLNVTSYGNCWKFEDSDMFCYEEDEDRLFLAYIVESAQPQTEILNLAKEVIGEPLSSASYETIEIKSSLYPSPIATHVITAHPIHTIVAHPVHSTVHITAEPISVETVSSLAHHDFPATTTYTSVDYATFPTTEQYLTSYTAEPLTTAYTSTIEPVMTSYTATSYEPVVTSYSASSYEPVTSSYSSSLGSYNTHNYDIGNSYTTPISTTTTSYSSPYAVSAAYEYRPSVATESSGYKVYGVDDNINSLVNKYLSGNVEAEVLAPSSSYSSSSYSYSSPYTPTTTTLGDKVSSTTTEYSSYTPEYTSYTPLSTPIDLKSTDYSKYQPLATSYAPSHIYATAMSNATPIDFGSNGGYSAVSSSSHTYQPTNTTSSGSRTYQPTSTSGSHTYQSSGIATTTYPVTSTSYNAQSVGSTSYGNYTSDFSNTDILNIIKRGTPGTTGTTTYGHALTSHTPANTFIQTPAYTGSAYTAQSSTGLTESVSSHTSIKSGGKGETLARSGHTRQAQQ